MKPTSGAILALAVMALLPSLARAQESIALLERSTPVSAYEDRLAWSRYDASTGRYALMTRVDGVTSSVPVATRGVPFDVDVGPDPHGDVAAVYSRCQIEPRSGDPRVRQWVAGTPQWSTGRGCDLYKYTFATGRETRIAAANSGGASEFLPTIWKERVAFARVYTHRPGVKGRRVYLYHRPVIGGGASQGLPEPPRGERGKVEPGPSSLDLYGRRLGVAWETYRGGPVSEIDLITIGDGRRLVERAGSGDIQAVNLVSPSLRAGRMHYGRGEFGDSTSGALHRYRIKTGAYHTVTVSDDRTLLATAIGRDGPYGLLSGGVDAGCYSETEQDAGVVVRAPCALSRLTGLSWRPFEPQRFGLR